MFEETHTSSSAGQFETTPDNNRLRSEPVMAAACHSELFVGLTVIVNDWDPPTHGRLHSATASNIRDLLSDTASAETTNSTASCATAYPQVPAMNLMSMAESMWSRVSFTFKQKLRSACMELLKRTEEPQQVEKRRGSKEEDDAHMLD